MTSELLKYLNEHLVVFLNLHNKDDSRESPTNSLINYARCLFAKLSFTATLSGSLLRFSNY